jgi:cyclophilin family peptidyl-prolyl cis-trans isomerase
MLHRALLVATAAGAVLAGCADTPLLDPTSCCAATSPATFDVQVATTAGAFSLHVERRWAPLGVDRFYNMIQCGYLGNGTGAGSYAAGNAAGFFRVVPDFVVQFGISGLPAVSGAWQNLEIKDDPVVLSNTAGSIAFATAGPDTRTTQVYINLGDNSDLDGQGFAPFGNITSAAGYAVVQKLYAGYGQTPDQDTIYAQGDAGCKCSSSPVPLPAGAARVARARAQPAIRSPPRVARRTRSALQTSFPSFRCSITSLPRPLPEGRRGARCLSKHSHSSRLEKFPCCCAAAIKALKVAAALRTGRGASLP